MQGVQREQLGFVGFVLFTSGLSCFITSRPRLASYIRRSTYTKTIGMGMSLALVIVHMIPVGFAQLYAVRNTWIQNFGGLYIALGVVLGVFIQILTHKQSALVPEAHVVTNLPVPIEDPLPQEQTCVLPDKTNFEMDTTSAQMTIDQTLYYPQYYNWDNMSNLHCSPVFAVTQLENTLTREYPLILKKENVVLQSFPQFNIPNYIHNNPQIITAHYNSYADDSSNAELDRIAAHNALQRTCGIVASCVFYGFFLGLDVGRSDTIKSLLVLLPSLLDFLVLQCFLFATFAQDTDGVRKHVVSILCMLFSLPIAAITFIILELENEHSLGVLLLETATLLLLLSAGFLLYHSLSALHSDMPKTRTNFIIIAVVMGLSFVLSLNAYLLY